MTKDTATRRSPDGLRYTSKETGSPFTGNGSTRSCFRCGRHRLPQLLQSIRILGRTEMVCKPSCKALAESVDGKGPATPETTSPETTSQ